MLLLMRCVEPPGLLSVMRCDFPIDNIQVSGRVHSTKRTNRSNRQRWTAGSVVSNEMRFSDRQYPGFGSCPVHSTNRTNRQRWTAGSVVSNEMRFFRSTTSRFRVVSIRRIERIGRIDNVEPPGLLSVMRCDFPIDNIQVSGRVRSIRRIERIGNVEPPGLLSVMRCDFPIHNIQVSGRVHSTKRTNRSNRQRWTAGSVVSNEMRFSDRQHQGFRSCPFDESDESIDSTGFIASLQLMSCNFPIDNE